MKHNLSLIFLTMTSFMFISPVITMDSPLSPEQNQFNKSDIINIIKNISHSTDPRQGIEGFLSIPKEDFETIDLERVNSRCIGNGKDSRLLEELIKEKSILSIGDFNIFLEKLLKYAPDLPDYIVLSLEKIYLKMSENIFIHDSEKNDFLEKHATNIPYFMSKYAHYDEVRLNRKKIQEAISFYYNSRLNLGPEEFMIDLKLPGIRLLPVNDISDLIGKYFYKHRKDLTPDMKNSIIQEYAMNLDWTIAIRFIQAQGSNQIDKIIKETMTAETVLRAFKGDIVPVTEILYDHVISPKIVKRIDEILRNEQKKDLSQRIISPENTKEIRKDMADRINKQIPKLYKNLLGDFSSLIFADISPTPKREPDYVPPNTVSVDKIIWNLESYDEWIPPIGNEILQKLCQKGHPVSIEMGETIQDSDHLSIIVDKKIPIGYTLSLPKVPIKGIMIKAYGGHQKKDRLTRLYRPNLPDNLEEHLLQKGIVVVSLNLIDLLELTVFQSLMPENIYFRIHAGIHKFFTTLKNTPKKIHPDLQFPQGIKIYLYGASFGGITSIRHAELYPDSFDGYISHDGALVGNVSNNTYNPFLLPFNANAVNQQCDPKINLIKQPILLLHNYDDHVVPVEESLLFYNAFQKCVKVNKDLKHKIQLFITEQGNPYPIDNEKVYKGHFKPVGETAFPKYAQVITEFILSGSTIFHKESKWMAFQYQIFAHLQKKEASIQERFISRAFRLYKHPFNIPNFYGQADPTQFNGDWDRTYAPLFSLISYIDFLKGNDILLEEDINQILQNPRKDEIIVNTLTYQLPFFMAYIREMYPALFTGDSMPSNLERNYDIKLVFMRYLRDIYGDPSLRGYLLYCVYSANPDLLQMRLQELQEQNIFSVSEYNLKLAKENLQMRLQEDSHLFKKVFQQKVPHFKDRHFWEPD